MTLKDRRHSEQLFRALIEHSTDAIALLTRDGTVIYASPSTERITGYTPEEFVGINAGNIVCAEDWQHVEWSSLLDQPGDSIAFALRMRHKNGSWHWMEGTFTNLLSNPAIGAVVGNYRDITERKLTEERLHESEERYRVLVEQASDGIFLTDHEGYFVDVNAAVCLLSGYTREELLTKNIADLTREEDRERLFLGRDALLTGEILRSRWNMKRKDGSIIHTEFASKQLSNGYLQGIVHDISERIQAEKEHARLLISEQTARAEAEAARAHLHDLFMQAPANIAILRGPERRFELANPLFLQTIGMSEKDVLGKPAREIMPHAARQGYTAIIDNVYKTGQPFVGTEMSVLLDRRGDGTIEEGFFNFVYQPFRNRQGEVDGILVHGVEVTVQVHARRRVEELVHQLEAEKEALWRAEREAAQHASHLTAVFEAITDGVMVCDTRGQILQSNSAFRSFLGLDEDDKTALMLSEKRRTWLIPHDPEGNPLPRERWPLVRALRGERLSGTDTVDVLQRTPGGKILFLNVSAAPIYDTADNIMGAVLVLRDVTERRQLEQQRQLSERKYRSLLDSNIVGVLVAGPGGKIYEVNDCLAKMFGYNKEELLSDDFSWDQFNPPGYKVEQDPTAQAMATTGVAHLVEKELIRKDGSSFPTLLAGTFFDQEQKQAVIMVLDISDRKEAERRKQEFLGMVSHELRSPLTAILGFIELAQFYLQQFPRNTPEEKDIILHKVETVLSRTNQQVNIECRLVEALLDVARMEMHKFELSLQEHNLVTVVREMVAYQQQLTPTRRIELLAPAQKHVPVHIDEDRIGQVLTNYLTNALRYSPGNKAIQVGLTVEGKSARVFVRDQGPGLTTEQQQHIWERFYQTESSMHRGSDGGLGLGLYIVKIIIQQHGGQVGVESESGQGSTFWFTLPLIDEVSTDRKRST